MPVIARNLLESIDCWPRAARVLAEKCVDGIEAERGGLRALGRGDAGGGTALNPLHRLRQGGGDRQGGGRLGSHAPRRRLRKGVDEETYNGAMDLRKMAHPHD